MEQKSLGEMIAKRRMEKGLSQEKVAEELGVSRQAVTKWESDSSRPSSDNLIALAKMLEISVDELLGNKVAGQEEGHNVSDRDVAVGEPPKQMVSRMPWLFFGISFLCLIAYGVIGGIYGRFYIGTMIELFIMAVPCQLFVHAVFGSAAKSGNFTMIAGYDPKVTYNTDEYKRVLSIIDISIGCTSAVYVFLIAAFALAELWPDWSNIVLLFMYVLSLTANILLINLKNADKLFTREEDAKRAKASLPIDAFFILLMILIPAALAVAMVRSSIENNTVSALGLCGLMFIGLGADLVGLFVEEHRLKKWDPFTSPYRPGICGIICAILCVLMIVVMLL